MSQTEESYLSESGNLIYLSIYIADILTLTGRTYVDIDCVLWRFDILRIDQVRL